MNRFNQGGFGLQILFLLLLAISFACAQDDISRQAAGEFNYDHQGDDWMGTCRDGKHQSPINLTDHEAITRYQFRTHYTFFDRPLKTDVTVVNNGNTVIIDLPLIRPYPLITGGLMKGAYVPRSVHFHWGSQNRNGSEHAINGMRFDAEMHIIHTNVKYMESVGEASRHVDGLAVLAAMIVAKPGSENRFEDTALHKIFDVLPQIIPYQSKATIYADFSLKQLLHDIEIAEFYTYKGSLTTPDCAESVTWTVFKEALSLPQSEISKLWNLRDSRIRPLINNYRNLQDINDRKIYYKPLYKDIFSNLYQSLADPFSAFF